MLFALASPARANFIRNVNRESSCTNLTIHLSQIPNAPLLVQLGNLVIPGSYNFSAQEIDAILPVGIAPRHL